MHDTLIQGPRESFRGTPDTGDDMNRGERAGLWGNQGLTRGILRNMVGTGKVPNHITGDESGRGQ